LPSAPEVPKCRFFPADQHYSKITFLKMVSWLLF